MYTTNSVIGAILIFLMFGCRGPEVVRPGSEAYNSTVTAFYSGVSAMEVGEDLRARAKLTLVTELAPTEPATWANLALMAMRQNDLETAQMHLNRALELDSTNSEIRLLAAAYARMTDDISMQLKHLRSVLSADSLNMRALFELVEILPEDSEERISVIEQLAIAAPGNTAVLLKQLEQSVLSGTLDLELLEQFSNYTWGLDVQDQIESLRGSEQGGDLTIQLAILRNIFV